jgi:hypothetical protein
MEEEVKYTSEFDGQTTDEVLKHAKSVKDLTIPSLSNISGFVCIDNEGKAIGMISKEQVAQVVGGLIGTATANKDGLLPKNKVLSLGCNELTGPTITIAIKNINRGADIEIIIANGPSWSTDKPNIILLHASFDSGNPNITVWKIMEGHSFNNIRIYKRGQDIYIPNVYTYSTRFSINVISDDNSQISVSSAITSDLNLLEEEKLSIG